MAARCYASHVDEAINLIFLQKAKEVIERVSGVPYCINDGFVHYAIYFFLQGLRQKEQFGISEQFSSGQGGLRAVCIGQVAK